MAIFYYVLNYLLMEFGIIFYAFIDFFQAFAEIITFVKAYGTHARAYIPVLQKTIYYFENEEGHIRENLRMQKAKDVRELIEHIKRTDYTPRLKRI